MRRWSDYSTKNGALVGLWVYKLPKALGELLTDLGYLRTDDNLAIHAARVVQIELPMFFLSLVEPFKLSYLSHYRARLGSRSI